MKQYKIVLLGAGGVGKSALTLYFVQGVFMEQYDPTVEDSYKKQVDVEGETYQLEILDTAGQEELASMRDQHMRNGHGFILVYSITSPATFSSVTHMRDQLCRVRETESVPMVIVGNKCDLENEREVTTEAGASLAKKFHSDFIETSAKNRVNIEEAFILLLKQLNKPPPSAKAIRVQKRTCDLV